MTRHLLTIAELDASPWASCGPASLAALLGRPLVELRDAFPAQRPGRTWTNFDQMLAAARPAAHPVLGWEDGNGSWPRLGLALVQFRGPWEAPGLPRAASLRRTHWVAVTPLLDGAGRPVGGPMVFDVNALDMNYGWAPRSWWEAHIIPEVASGLRGATGAWWVRAGIEVCERAEATR